MSKRSLVGLTLVLAMAFVAPLALAQETPPNDGRYLVKFKDFRDASQAVRAHGGQPVLELEPQRVVAAISPNKP